MNKNSEIRRKIMPFKWIKYIFKLFRTRFEQVYLKFIKFVKIKFMKSSIILLVLVLALSTACNKEPSDSVDQDKIFASYVLEYNGSQDITYARANFHFSNAAGTKLELVDPASVTIDGEIIPFKQALAYYEKDYVGLKNSGDFEYTDVDGNIFNNTVSMIDSLSFPSGIDTLSRSQNFQLFWTGSPVQQGEVITVTIIGSGAGDGQIFTQAGVGATSIVLTQNKLQNLGLENAQFYIRRSKNVAAQEVTSAGGNVIARYDAPSIKVYIEQ